MERFDKAERRRADGKAAKGKAKRGEAGDRRAERQTIIIGYEILRMGSDMKSMKGGPRDGGSAVDEKKRKRKKGKGKLISGEPRAKYRFDLSSGKSYHLHTTRLFTPGL